MVTETAPRVTVTLGWLKFDDLAHFTRVLTARSAAGLRGDLPEIGYSHCRSATVLACCLRTGERLILADAFHLPPAEPYRDSPSPKRVWHNLADRIEIRRCYSRDLHLHPAPEIRLRLANVDGGHDAETVQTGLAPCAERTVPAG